jgi:hypothetical protein
MGASPRLCGSGAELRRPTTRACQIGGVGAPRSIKHRVELAISETTTASVNYFSAANVQLVSTREGGDAMYGSEMFSALTKAWLTTVVAVGVLTVALGIAQIWDTQTYFRALHEALISDPA